MFPSNEQSSLDLFAPPSFCKEALAALTRCCNKRFLIAWNEELIRTGNISIFTFTTPPPPRSSCRASPMRRRRCNASRLFEGRAGWSALAAPRASRRGAALRDLFSASGAAVSDADLRRVYLVCRQCCGRGRVRAFISRVLLHPAAAAAGHELLAQLTAHPLHCLASQLNLTRWRAMLRCHRPCACAEAAVRAVRIRRHLPAQSRAAHRIAVPFPGVETE
jgi:hypothetical protein